MRTVEFKYRHDAGFGLIEVLIAMAILLVGLSAILKELPNMLRIRWSSYWDWISLTG